jgi:hypothetical protein
MEQTRSSWSDDRLDHLSEQVDALRRHMDERLERQDIRIEERFEKQSARIETRFDALQNGMIITLASILAAFGSALFAIRF